MNLVNEIKEIVKNGFIDAPSIRNELLKYYPKANSDNLLKCVLLIAEIDPELTIDKSRTDHKFYAVGSTHNLQDEK